MADHGTPGTGKLDRQPDVSVLMPVHNGERFLGQALDSLLQQTFSALEIIVVDDGSTDSTKEIAEAYAAKDARVRVHSHGTTRGAPAARNTALRQVSPSSRYVMNHDCDDISFPRKIERLVACLDHTPGLSAAGCFCDYIDEEGKRIGWTPLEWQPALIRATFGRFNSMVNSATLVRRKVFEEVGPFNEQINRCDDYDFWARAILRGHLLANIPEVLHVIRLHSSSMGAAHAGQMSAQAQAVGTMYRKGRKEGAAGKAMAWVLQKSLPMRSHVRRFLSSRSRFLL